MKKETMIRLNFLMRLGFMSLLLFAASCGAPDTTIDSLGASVTSKPKLQVVSFNMYNYKTYAGIGWKDRQTNFANDVVKIYRPGIITLQEVMLNTKGCWDWCSNCYNIADGAFIKHFLDTINRKIDRSKGQYYVATITKSNHSIYCFPPADVWEGDAIIYDSSQVNFIPSPPIHGDSCLEWWNNVTSLYEYTYTDERDCLDYESESSQADVIRAVFEYPKGTGRYLSVYSVHAPIPNSSNPDDWKYWRMVEYVEERQVTLRQDLESHYLPLLYHHKGYGQFEHAVQIYPPIFTGDFNTNSSAIGTPPILKDLDAKFTRTPTGPIDMVNFGRSDVSWDHDVGYDVIVPPINADEILRKRGKGWITIKDIYSDHRPVMGITEYSGKDRCNNSCNGGQACCYDTCEITTSNDEHCGVCGNTCPTGTNCCGLTCLDLKNDNDNCGSCGRPCGSGKKCVAGQCVCYPTCGGKECGIDGCGRSCGTCSTGQYCDFGECKKIDKCGRVGDKCDAITECCLGLSCGNGRCRAL